MVKIFGLNTAVENHFEITEVNGLNTLSPVLEYGTVKEEEETPVFEINTTHVGEISDEEDLGPDLRGIPTTESFGIAAATEEEEVEEAVVVSSFDEEDEDSTEESVW
jgi:hypothetical protein